MSQDVVGSKVMVTLKYPRKLPNLIRVVYAITDSWRHEENTMEVLNEDGMSVRVSTAVNLVYYGRASARDKAKCWAVNIPRADVMWLCNLVYHRRYDELAEYDWQNHVEQRTDSAGIAMHHSPSEGPEGKKVMIGLEDDRKLSNLIEAVYAITDSRRPEKNTIEVVNEHGISVKVSTDFNRVWYGQASAPDESKRWAESIPDDDVRRLCNLVSHGFHDQLEEYPWASGDTILYCGEGIEKKEPNDARDAPEAR